jgi:hypothetical protein
MGLGVNLTTPRHVMANVHCRPVQQHRDGHRSWNLLQLPEESYQIRSHRCAMESLRLEQDKLDKKGSLSKTIDHVQKTIDLLVAARQAIATGMPDSILMKKHKKC